MKEDVVELIPGSPLDIVVGEFFAKKQVVEEIESKEPIPPAITIIIPTYNRSITLVQTVDRLMDHIRYRGRLEVLIGDDSTDPVEMIPPSYFPDTYIKVLPGPKKGLGANLNMLLRSVETDLVLQLDDDHWLDAPLDLTQYAADLRNDDFNMGWVRLFLGEVVDAYNLKTYYKFKAASYGPYWYIDTESPTLYIASNRPHLKKVGMHTQHFGWYPEGKRLGKTEEGFCHQYKATKKHQAWQETPWITIPMFNLQINQWRHVGDSWQKRGK